MFPQLLRGRVQVESTCPESKAVFLEQTCPRPQAHETLVLCLPDGCPAMPTCASTQVEFDEMLMKEVSWGSQCCSSPALGLHFSPLRIWENSLSKLLFGRRKMLIVSLGLGSWETHTIWNVKKSGFKNIFLLIIFYCLPACHMQWSTQVQTVEWDGGGGGTCREPALCWRCDRCYLLWSSEWLQEVDPVVSISQVRSLGLGEGNWLGPSRLFKKQEQELLLEGAEPFEGFLRVWGQMFFGLSKETTEGCKLVQKKVSGCWLSCLLGFLELLCVSHSQD